MKVKFSAVAISLAVLFGASSIAGAGESLSALQGKHQVVQKASTKQGKDGIDCRKMTC